MKTAKELFTAIAATHAELCEGKIDVKTARTRARLYDAAARSIETRFRHARETDRLKQFDDELPDMKVA